MHHIYRLGEILNNTGGGIIYLVGGSDDRGIVGGNGNRDFKSNYELSLLRAEAVALELASQHSITNIKIMGVSDNYSSLAPSYDRRVDIYITNSIELIDLIANRIITN